jgi:hypothetical protein
MGPGACTHAHTNTQTQTHTNMISEGRNHETATDSHCRTGGRVSMVTHIHNGDVSCWLTQRPYSNSTVWISLNKSCQQYRGWDVFYLAHTELYKENTTHMSICHETRVSRDILAWRSEKCVFVSFFFQVKSWQMRSEVEWSELAVKHSLYYWISNKPCKASDFQTTIASQTWR